MASIFRWFGDRIRQVVQERIDNQLYRMGEEIVARAQQLAPVRTGRLKSSIAYVVAHGEGRGRSMLSIQVGAPYGIFVEFGTRYMSPRPYIRPALLAVGRAWGADLEMSFAAPSGPGGGPWHGLLAGTGQGRQPGFAASASPHYRPLSEQQKRHVERVLIPSVKRYHRGNVKRAKFRVRHV